MIRFSTDSGIALALALAAVVPATGALAADTTTTTHYKKGHHVRHPSTGRTARGQPGMNPKPGAGPMTGSRSDTSSPSSSAPATNQPSAPTGH